MFVQDEPYHLKNKLRLLNLLNEIQMSYCYCQNNNLQICSF